MKLIITVFIGCLTFAVSCFGEEKKAEGHVIPKDSKVEYDFRGKTSPFLMSSEAAKKLPQCKTYEELRDTLKLAIPELTNSKW